MEILAKCLGICNIDRRIFDGKFPAHPPPKSPGMNKKKNDQKSLERLLREVRACRACEKSLPLGPRPILRASSTARILVVGQAPGTRVHETGVPWNDPSGDRLREWMNVDRKTFYDESRIAIIPMGLCYPGKGKGGDLPPRRECAEIWLDRLLALLPALKLTILCGRYAHRHYLGKREKKTLTKTVRAWREYIPQYIVLPHPSPRNIKWFRTNAWFHEEVIPDLRTRVEELLED